MVGFLVGRKARLLVSRKFGFTFPSTVIISFLTFDYLCDEKHFITEGRTRFSSGVSSIKRQSILIAANPSNFIRGIVVQFHGRPIAPSLFGPRALNLP